MKIKHQTVQKMATPGQTREFISSIIESIPVNLLTPDDMQFWIGKKGKLAAELKKILVRLNLYTDLISEWEKFYRDLGIDCDLSDVRIPDDPGGFGRVIIMAKGITPQSAYDLCVKFFTCWKWTNENLDKIVTSDRTTKSPYAIRIRERVEADEELKNLSANQLKEQGITGITLEERLIYELKYYKETGEHLDISNWTLCAGSRCSGGDVPEVHWVGGCGELCVYWYVSVDASGVHLRSRSAVS